MRYDVAQQSILKFVSRITDYCRGCDVWLVVSILRPRLLPTAHYWHQHWLCRSRSREMRSEERREERWADTEWAAVASIAEDTCQHSQQGKGNSICDQRIFYVSDKDIIRFIKILVMKKIFWDMWLEQLLYVCLKVFCVSYLWLRWEQNITRQTELCPGWAGEWVSEG